ncbi:MAG: acyltransferase family protein [Acidimicrobiales bacterium]
MRRAEGAEAGPTEPHLRAIPALDGVRAVAVTAVVIHHVEAFLTGSPSLLFHDGPLQGGFLGVDVFFVLSGLLITSLLVREHAARRTIGIGRFLWHRILRLVPALWVMLGVHVVYAKATDLSMTTEWHSVRAGLVYLSNWAWHWDGLDTAVGLGHLWSLSIEFQFYLVWPFVVLAALRLDRSGRLLAGVAAAGVVAVLVRRWVLIDQGTGDFLIYQRTDTRADSLLVGALLAVVWWRRPRWLEPLRWAAWPATALVLLALVVVGFDDRWLFTFGFTLIALAIAVVLGGVLATGWPGERFLALAPWCSWAGSPTACTSGTSRSSMRCAATAPTGAPRRASRSASVPPRWPPRARGSSSSGPCASCATCDGPGSSSPPGRAPDDGAGRSPPPARPGVAVPAGSAALRWRPWPPRGPRPAARSCSGSGWNKTGTRSLHEALEVLGYAPLHWGGPASRLAVERAEAEGVPLLSHLRATTPSPTSWPSRSASTWWTRKYPGNRFVLTTRSLEGWLASRRRHVERNRAEAAAGRYHGDFLEIDEDAWRAERAEHHARVRAHFASRPEALLELDVEVDGHRGWDLLCPFLGLAVPDRPFPWEGRDPEA